MPIVPNAVHGTNHDPSRSMLANRDEIQGRVHSPASTVEFDCNPVSGNCTDKTIRIQMFFSVHTNNWNAVKYLSNFIFMKTSQFENNRKLRTEHEDIQSEFQPSRK